MLNAWEQRLGKATRTQLSGERRDAVFHVQLTDTKDQRTATEQNQQACSQTPFWLQLGLTKLIFVCIVQASLLVPMDSPAKERKLGIKIPTEKAGT